MNPGPAPVRQLALIALLMLLCALPYPFTTLILDATRDLVFASRIAAGEAYPAQGPVINATLHLGPIWFYLLAPVLAATKSTAAALLFVGLLDALKFPLAYAIGRQLRDTRFGLALALALAFPNWALAGALLVTHTSVVQTALLAALWCALRTRDRDTATAWLLLGLALGLALHAHPATVVLSPLLLGLAWAGRHAPWPRQAWRWGLVALAAALPFLPMLVDEALRGWPVLQRAAHYPEAGTGWGDPAAILGGGLLGGAVLLIEHLADSEWRLPLWLLAGGLVALAAVGLGRALRTRAGRQRAAFCTLALALGLLGLAWLRDRTPFYMALLLWPAAAGLLALGGSALAARWPRTAGPGVAALLALPAIAAGLLVARAEQGAMRLPTPALFDVAQWRTAGDLKALLPAWRADRFGRQLCAAPGRHVLHADLATGFDSALGLGMRLACGGTDRVGIGGGSAEPAARHHLGLTPHALRQLGLAPAAGWDDSLGLAPRRVVAGEGSQAIPDGLRYPFRVQDVGTPREQVWRLETRPDEVVILTTPFRPYDDATPTGARANGTPMSPAYASQSALAYRCAHCAPPVRWELRVRTGYPERVDVVVAGPAPAAD